MNLQVIASLDGDIVWVRAAVGAVHDRYRGPELGIMAVLAASDPVVPSDKGYLGNDCCHTPSAKGSLLSSNGP